ncbi:unnamed protein product (macronuclear) [Paramecium tetraurelia]|uniref:ATP-dependent helicase C-terminal domain-containing protein n=1 Tax=Paramecium tetraurelia TaxID=5888 RepID=A0CLN8_PARTE|nr:uncharacterized protein GSPATT00008254001 [Paramecium tetraurelia]CAK71705.1 unnamed protein product [Paramecium tetraurelia]|eukprot:XP_001439102.1 hypothetical protein (macronuclear) [Paramecium tetraurelia strain d4-2]
MDEESELVNKILKEIQIDSNMCNEQVQLMIDNTPVYFPHQPYEVLKVYMESVINALNKKQNALQIIKITMEDWNHQLQQVKPYPCSVPPQHGQRRTEKINRILISLRILRLYIHQELTLNQNKQSTNPIFQYLPQEINIASERKVAEGIDFSDELCRAIFLVGVPYPVIIDNRFIEKMNYLDRVFNDLEFNHQQRIKSSKWYTQQAIRATNQAIGRVIRHINDYGIVYLCDKRFEYKEIRQGLSKWAQPAIQPWINDDDVIQQTKSFFNRSMLE